MPSQQQALSPLILAQRYAQRHRAPRQGNRWLAATVVLIVGLLLLVAFPSLPGSSSASTFLLTFLLVFGLPALLTQAGSNKKEEDSLYAELLALLKDDTLPFPLTERVAVLALLPPTTPPPLPALAQARLAQKLAYAHPNELASLPRAPLYAWLESPETPDDLKIALLLTLGSAPDASLQALAQQLATTARTERLREAAQECLNSLESAP